MQERDVFAAVALHTLIGKLPLLDNEGEHGPKSATPLMEVRAELARSAYDYADEMMRQRSAGATAVSVPTLDSAQRLRHG